VLIRLEVRLPADVALVGLPNAGKSALVCAISGAVPKVAAYAFTTVEPLLAAVELGHEAAVVVDLPALVAGAHLGAGLGASFLRHARRALLLVHVVDASEREPLRDMDVLRQELAAFGDGLDEKDWVVALNKIDIPGAAERAERAARELAGEGIEAYGVSASTGAGTDALLGAVLGRLRGASAEGTTARKEGVSTSTQRAESSQVEVVRIRRGFEVRGDEPARVVRKLGTESAEARAEVARRLGRVGVLSALRRAGVNPGDRVRIGGIELEWPL
jgi:GTP-binding protein